MNDFQKAEKLENTNFYGYTVFTFFAEYSGIGGRCIQQLLHIHHNDSCRLLYFGASLCRRTAGRILVDDGGRANRQDDRYKLGLFSDAGQHAGRFHGRLSRTLFWENKIR